MTGTPHRKAVTSSKSYLANGRKPRFDLATDAAIKKANDRGVSMAELARLYGVKPDTIRSALIRAEFGQERASGAA